jgi:hypothetical protein
MLVSRKSKPKIFVFVDYAYIEIQRIRRIRRNNKKAAYIRIF